MQGLLEANPWGCSAQEPPLPPKWAWRRKEEVACRMDNEGGRRPVLPPAGELMQETSDGAHVRIWK